MKLRASGSAQSRNAIAFCCDQNYLPFAAFAAHQIATEHPDREFDICLCSDEELALPLELESLGLRVLQIDTDGQFGGLRLDARRTEAAYLRLALPDALQDDYDRILYLDSDIYYRHGNIGRLLKSDLGGYCIAAVRENIQWRTPDRRPQQFRTFGWPGAPYLNSGLLIFDVPEFVRTKLMKSCIELGLREKNRLIGHDQTLLNCMLRGAWTELSPLWNWQFTWSNRHFGTMEDACIFHFIGKTKPWNDVQGRLPLGLGRAYAGFFGHYFLDKTVAIPARPLSNPGPLTLSMLKHALSARAMSRYLARFPDAYATRPAGT